MPDEPSDARSLDEQFSRLWENDRRAQRERLAVLARAMLNHGDSTSRAAAAREAHALAGVAAMYGFAKAAAIARTLEESFDAAAPLPPDTGILVSELAAALEEPYRPRG
ncbi:MAG TPA: Hpt domain-containing protein [Candidatus Limnocylindria bacterium]